jgi:hypothetical protein
MESESGRSIEGSNDIEKWTDRQTDRQKARVNEREIARNKSEREGER